MALLDYSFNTEAYLTTGYATYSTHAVAQTFTARFDSTLTSVKLMLYKVGSPGDLNVQIWATSGGKPTGSAIVSDTISSASITTDTDGAWYEADFGAGTSLIASTVYAIVVWPASGELPDDYIEWKEDDSHRYSYGKLYFFLNSTWAAAPDADVGFELYGTATGGGLSKPTTPTPSNGATAVDFTGFQFSWVNGGGATAYDVYIGPTGNLIRVSTGQVGTSYTTSLSELQSIFAATPINQKIYWRVDASDESDSVTGDEWNFDARPAKVTTPDPAISATGIRLFPTYGWTVSSIATSYNLHVGI